MVLATCEQGAYISLIFLISFLLLDAHYWHILPLPAPLHHITYSAHLPSMEISRQGLSPQAAYDVLSDTDAPLNLTLSNHGAATDINGKKPAAITYISSNLSSKIDATDHDSAANLLATLHQDIKSNSTASIIPPPPEILSLRRLEADLRDVRSALRKVMQTERRGIKERALRGRRRRRKPEYGPPWRAPAAPLQSEQPEYVPWGPVYRDASIFRQSYIEMQRRFKVFIYPEGQQPLVHNGPCKEIYSSEGRFIQELQDNRHFVTMDPLKAHVFFLPFSVSMMVTYLYTPLVSKGMKPLKHFVHNYVNVIGAKYPFWNRSLGADHFMLSCHDWGPAISKAQPQLEKRAIRVLCNANSSEGFVPHKDASLPEINLVGGYIPAALGGLPMKDRNILAFFAGQDHGPVRPLLHKHWEGRDDSIQVYYKLPAHANKHSYHEHMKRSKFCLCPAGYEVNSPRIVEAIYNDCIPVIIADGFVLPFSDVLNWDAFSLTVLQADIPKLKEILTAIPESKREEMQAGVRRVKRHFLLNQPPQPYDAFHMILHSVWLRRLNIRLSYH